MKINNKKIDNTVKYSATFYNNLNAEQERYTRKVMTDNDKEKKCLIEEVDCQNSVSTLRYHVPKFKYQDIPIRKIKETVNKRQIKMPSENPNKEKVPQNRKINTDPDEKCVIEEVDCKLSLIDIGYEESEDEVDVKIVDETIYEFENNTLAETYDQSMDISNTNIIEAEVDQSLAELCKDNNIDKYSPKYDINNYFSSSIIASVEDYTFDNDSKKETLINRDDEDMKESQNIKVDDKTEAYPSSQEETKSKNIKDVFQEVRNSLMKGLNTKMVLHTEAIYMENKLGFLSLISVMGLFGILTDNRACLGFFSFLYFIRYFFIMPDETFKTSLLKATAPAFFTNIIFSILTIVLWLLINDVVLLLLGLGIGMVAAVIVFTVILAVCGKKKMVVTKNEIT